MSRFDEEGTLSLGTLEVGARRRHAAHAKKKKSFRWARLQPFGIGVVIFNATSATSLNAQNTVQKLYHPKRLIIDIARTGTTATGLLTVTRIDIGADNQMATSGGAGPVPVALYANVGVDLNQNYAVLTPGITMTVQLTISILPSSTDQVACSVGCSGSAREVAAPIENY